MTHREALQETIKIVGIMIIALWACYILASCFVGGWYFVGGLVSFPGLYYASLRYFQ